MSTCRDTLGVLSIQCCANRLRLSSSTLPIGRHFPLDSDVVATSGTVGLHVDRTCSLVSAQRPRPHALLSITPRIAARLQASLSSKDMELVNLNSALGQYYAETEAKVRS